MLASVYDPNSVGDDAFDMDNMTEGSTNKILTATERSNISTAASHVSSTSNPHSVTASQAGAVATSGDETIAGVKTFSSSPIVPTPTTDYQAATKKYVDDNAGSGGGLSAYGFIYRTTTKDLAATNTWYDIEFDANGTLSNITHSTSTNTERVTVDAAGVYEITYQIQMHRGNGNDHHHVARLYKNGSSEITGSYALQAVTGDDVNEIHHLTHGVIASLSASDYVTVQIGTNVLTDNEIAVYDDGNLPNPAATIYASVVIKKLN